VQRDDETERRIRFEHVKECWGQWLESLGPWDHFATLTFNFEASARSAVRSSRDWLRWCERRAQQRVDWFYVVEGGDRSRVHVHVLVVGTVNVSAADLADGWRHGIAHVVPYTPSAGGDTLCRQDLGWWRGDV
jgi:hypothetical protein